MQRRTLLKMATLTAAAAGTPRLLASIAGQTSPPAPSEIKRVLVVCKCHLDVGFTETQALVMRKYFDVYYPAAIERAARLRAAGPDRYTWTTGSWLLYEYLEQASPAQRTAMEHAIAAGDITWHALPFSWQTEMLDRSMIEGALGLSAALDQRFGRKTIGAKMTDVPGHSRGIIAPLAAAGVRLLDIGVNAASTPPDVPDIFLWKDPAGDSLAMIYHRMDYGGVVPIPGTGVAVSVQVRNDNSGPHTTEEIAAIYAKLRAQFPGADVRASNLNEVALAVDPIRANLPVVTSEIGDTWIYGIPSDPLKVARYREVARLRRSWIAARRFIAGDPIDRQLLRRVLLAVEHTWGTDTKSYLDNQHYRPADLAKVLDQPPYKVMQTSWAEKRDDIDLGLATLPEPLRTEARTRLDSIAAKPPSIEGLLKHDPLNQIGTHLQGKHYTLAIDAQTGAITRLLHHATGREWASPEAPLALFTYQTLSSADFASYLERYVHSKEDWAPRDFGKPGIEAFAARSQTWRPRLLHTWTSHRNGDLRVLLHLQVDDAPALATGNVAWPADLYVDLLLPETDPVVHLRLTTLGKRANRLPEAMWLSFNPPTRILRGVTLNKVDQTVLASDVVRGGGRSMHAVSDRISFEHPSGGPPLQIVTLDAPVIALGERSPLNFSPQLPSIQAGAHISLFNNAWGTNYPQWSSGDWTFRFTLSA